MLLSRKLAACKAWPIGPSSSRHLMVACAYALADVAALAGSAGTLV